MANLMRNDKKGPAENRLPGAPSTLGRHPERAYDMLLNAGNSKD